MSEIEALIDEVFDGKPHALRPEFAGWLRQSRRYRAFADRYRTKIRAKLRNASDDGGLSDVRAELETATVLLREERFALEYEAYAAAKQRGPDFTVTFKGHVRFNVEVRRLRGESGSVDSAALAAKLTAVLCEKTRQMPPGIVNLLWLATDGAVSVGDVAQAATGLRQLAERKADDYFLRRGYKSSVEFLRLYSQLSAVAIRQDGEIALWQNPLGRHKTPPDVTAAIRRLGRESEA